MRSEIINVGDELLSGRVSESCAFLSRGLSSIGLQAERIITSKDDPGELKDILSGASERAELVFIVGGLGAAYDDITRGAAAAFLERKLRFSRRAMANVARYFASRGEKVPNSCEKQAEVIEGAEVLVNNRGSSPGQMVEERGLILVLLPGPVAEVRDILEGGLLEKLKSRFESRIIRSSRIRLLGVCEGEAFEKLAEIIRTERELEEGVLDFSFEDTPAGCDFIIKCSGTNELLVDELIHKTKAEVYDVLKENIYAEGEETLEGALGRVLAEKRMTLSVAESCTGGLLSSRITDASGSSVYFRQGLVVYSTRAKTRFLGVDEGIIKKHGAVSGETAIEMARRAKELSGSSCAVSVTGYAGPGAGEGGKPGTGYVALSIGDEKKLLKVAFTGPRKEIKERFVAAALGFLWETLQSN